MAYFRVNATNTDVAGGSVTIAAASAGNRARFIALGFSNNSATTQILRIYDGTAASGTIRVEIAIGAGGGGYSAVDLSGKSVFPKIWWTSGNAIQADLAAAGDVRIYGEIIREA